MRWSMAMEQRGKGLTKTGAAGKAGVGRHPARRLGQEVGSEAAAMGVGSGEGSGGPPDGLTHINAAGQFCEQACGAHKGHRVLHSNHAI